MSNGEETLPSLGMEALIKNPVLREMARDEIMSFNMKQSTMETNTNKQMNKEITSIYNNILYRIKNPELDIHGKIIPYIFMPVSIQGAGKTTLYNKINAELQTLNNTEIIGMASADTYMPKQFNFKLLKECHRKCIEDTLKLIKSGKHCFLDNLNGLAHFRTIYKLICDVHGSILVPYIIYPDKWLVCKEADSDEEFLKTIISRCDNRYKLGGKYIDKDIIMRTINSIRNDYSINGNNIKLWLNSFPNPSYIPGFNIVDSQYILRNNIIDKMVDEHLRDIRLINRKEDVLNKHIQRGIENHITLIDSSEMTHEIELKIKDFTLDGFKLPISKGIGRYVNEDNEDTIFIVLEWEYGNKLRKSIGLKEKDFHITLMWSGKYNITNVCKNITTINW